MAEISRVPGYEQEVARGERFRFGKNWQRFLSVLDDERIAEAESSLRSMLGVENLRDRRFLDAGSGSGLFSLAARRMGAQVHSFDYDPESVRCTEELKRRYFPRDEQWKIEAGSVLDRDFLGRLGKFDVVYSWGVLHHTGALRQAMENVAALVDEGGRLFIAIYNDQGNKSRAWRAVKRIYCSSRAGTICMIGLFVPYFVVGGVVVDLFLGRNPIVRYREYKKSRGMSFIHNVVDWVGGYPFEVAKPEEVFEFYQSRGFVLEKLITCGGGLGNNQFVFAKK